MGHLMASTSAPELLEKVYKIRRENVVYRHTGPVPDLEKPDPDVSVDRVTAPLVDELVDGEARRRKFHEFLADGREGFIAHDDGDLVARGWVCTPYSETVPYNLPEWTADLDVYWLFYARTMQGHRRRGWHQYLIAHRLQWIYERDSEATVFTDAEPDNVSRQTFVTTGFEPWGMMTTYRIGHPSLAVKQLGTWDVDADHPPLPGER